MTAVPAADARVSRPQSTVNQHRPSSPCPADAAPDLPAAGIARALARSTRHAIVVTDANGDIRWSNAAFANLLDVAPETLPGRALQHVLATTDLAADRPPFCGTMPWRRANGGAKWLAIEQQPDEHGTGRITLVSETAPPDTTATASDPGVLQVILDAIPAYVFLKDDQNTILALNRRAAESLGQPPAAIVGRRTEQFFAADAAAAYLRDDREVLASGRPRLGIVEEYVVDSGEVRSICTDKIPLQGSDGRCDRLVAVATDVTDVLRTRRDLADTQERLSLAMKAANIGSWDWVIPSGATVFSDTYYTMLGYTPGELPMRASTWLTLVHPDDVPATQQALQRHFAGQEATYTCQFRCRAKDGSWRWIRAEGEVIAVDRDGRPRRMLGVHVDIHDQVVAERARQAVEQRLRLFVEHTSAAVAMFDRELRYLVASAGWYTQYGLRTDDLIGRCHYDVFPTLPERWREEHRPAASPARCAVSNAITSCARTAPSPGCAGRCGRGTTRTAASVAWSCSPRSSTNRCATRVRCRRRDDRPRRPIRRRASSWPT